jgi:hypothetical protein
LLCPVGEGHGQVGVLADDLCFFEAGHDQEKRGSLPPIYVVYHAKRESVNPFQHGSLDKRPIQGP